MNCLFIGEETLKSLNLQACQTCGQMGMWPVGPGFDMLERIGDYSCQNHLSSRDKPFGLRIPARLSTNAGESGLCAALALKGSGKPLEQRKHAPLGNGACSVRIPAYS